MKNQQIEKRLRRLKFEKYNTTSNSNPNVKKMAALLREKDLNSSDNESPDESDGGMYYLLFSHIKKTLFYRIDKK